MRSCGVDAFKKKKKKEARLAQGQWRSDDRLTKVRRRVRPANNKSRSACAVGRRLSARDCDETGDNSRRQP